VPADLTTPAVDADAVFGAEHVAEAKRYERFHYVNWVLAQLALLGTLWLYARRGAVFVRESAAGPIGTGMLLGMLGLGIAWLVGIPFRLASHWWQRRHDRSELGYVSWVFEDWMVLGAQFLAVSAALIVVMALARWLGERWWLPGAAVFVAIAAVFTFSAPYLDFETKPLEDEALLASAETYRTELGLGGIPLRVLEVSGDSQQANAYAYGIGPTRRVVFWDTMLKEPFDEDEQRVVLAHELAHHSQRHLPEGLAWFALFTIPGAWILMRATRRRGGMGVPDAVPLALLVVVVLQLALAPAANLLSRRMEAEADWKALQVARDPAALERLLAGFSETSLGDPTPPGWVQLLVGTHPALADRVAMARAWADREAR
jgi:STE24 endopeptidase